MRPAGWSPTLRRWTNHALPRHPTSRPAGWSPMRPAGWSPTLRRWRGGDSEPVRPDPPNATGRRWRLAGREGGTGRTPQHYPKARAGRRPPTPQTEQNQHPPGASQRPTPDCSAAEPPHVGAPAFSSPPAGGQNLPTGAHSRRCTGLRAGARVSKRASAPGSSFRTHAGNTSTVDSVLGLPVFVVPYIKAHFCTLGVGELHSRRVPSGGGKRGTTWRQI